MAQLATDRFPLASRGSPDQPLLLNTTDANGTLYPIEVCHAKAQCTTRHHHTAPPHGTGHNRAHSQGSVCALPRHTEAGWCAPLSKVGATTPLGSLTIGPDLRNPSEYEPAYEYPIGIGVWVTYCR